MSQKRAEFYFLKCDLELDAHSALKWVTYSHEEDVVQVFLDLLPLQISNLSALKTEYILNNCTTNFAMTLPQHSSLNFLTTSFVLLLKVGMVFVVVPKVIEVVWQVFAQYNTSDFFFFC